MKKSLHIGINDYPGTRNDLRGCLNDMNGWADLAECVYGFETERIANKQATRDVFLSKLNHLIDTVREKDDEILITFSGHGTSVPDRDGDELNGRDEALCLYDKLVIDDEIYYILKRASDDVHITFIADNCHSGTITRSFINAIENEETDCHVRYMPPEDAQEASLLNKLDLSRKFHKRREEIHMKEVLMTGCLPHEYSYDARFRTGFWGAFSYTALNYLNKNPDINYQELHDHVRKTLPNRQFPQTPQLEGKPENFKRKFLGGKITR